MSRLFARKSDFFNAIKYLGCEKEDCFRDVLASIFGGEVEVNFGFLVVDILVDDIGIEVEYEKPFYAGFCQALAYRAFLNIRDSYLIHIYKFVSEDLLDKVFKMAKLIKIKTVVINLTEEKIYDYTF